MRKCGTRVRIATVRTFCLASGDQRGRPCAVMRSRNLPRGGSRRCWGAACRSPAGRAGIPVSAQVCRPVWPGHAGHRNRPRSGICAAAHPPPRRPESLWVARSTTWAKSSGSLDTLSPRSGTIHAFRGPRRAACGPGPPSRRNHQSGSGSTTSGRSQGMPTPRAEPRTRSGGRRRAACRTWASCPAEPPARHRGINDLGQIAGFADTSSGAEDAFRWTPSRGMQDLGVLQAEPTVPQPRSTTWARSSEPPTPRAEPSTRSGGRR